MLSTPSTIKTLEDLLPAYDSVSIFPNTKIVSSSQFIKYVDSPPDFFSRYIIGFNDGGSPAMLLGRIFSAAYADRNLDFRLVMHLGGFTPAQSDMMGEILKRMPVLKGGSPELALVAPFGEWGLRATLDDYVGEYLTIIENKTGQVPWTQDRVNCDLQLTIQAWVHWKLFGVPPRRIILNWWNTKQKNFPELHSFNTSRSLKVLREFDDMVAVVFENLSIGNFSKNIYE